jgi:hypothetical protein
MAAKHNGGSTWSDATPASGPATPVWNGTAWQYVNFLYSTGCTNTGIK